MSVRNFSFSLALAATLVLSGCSTYPRWLPASGPSAEQVAKAPSSALMPNIRVMDISPALTSKLLASSQLRLFSELAEQDAGAGYAVGSGDVLSVVLWEAPPASLFGAAMADVRGSATAQSTTLPEQMVNAKGLINVPFVGNVQAAGRLPQQIEEDIVQRLKGKAHQPQAMVRLVSNASSRVTVVGEVAQSTRLPLTARGERVLDALAAAGGARQPVGKTTVQLTRGRQVMSLPLDMLIKDPLQNIVLHPGDVLTALHQPLSLTVLGATGINRELEFEAQGITLAQALGRVGGLQDQRADAKGVFVFRFEEAEVFGVKAGSRTTPNGKVAVVYRVDLRDPASFFVAQDFPMRNKDVMYVANAPAAELQKFLTIVGSVVSPANAIRVMSD